jgi:hypothetical protein
LGYFEVMGLINRRKQPISARSFGTWRWYGDDNTWSISFNNQLFRTIQMSVQHLAMGISEIDRDRNFPDTPTTGKRIQISGMQGFGDDYRWFAYIHGADGRQYFYQKVDALISARQRVKFEARDIDEINRVPYEADGEIPDSSTHRKDAIVSDSDTQGRSESPTMSVTDESFAAIFAPMADLSESTYDELCSFLFGSAKPWQEKVLEELKQRHESGNLDMDEMNQAISRFKNQVEKNQANEMRRLAAEIEAQLRRAQGFGFDPPGGWGALGPD